MTILFVQQTDNFTALENGLKELDKNWWAQPNFTRQRERLLYTECHEIPFNSFLTCLPSSSDVTRAPSSDLNCPFQWNKIQPYWCSITKWNSKEIENNRSMSPSYRVTGLSCVFYREICKELCKEFPLKLKRCCLFRLWYKAAISELWPSSQASPWGILQLTQQLSVIWHRKGSF